MIFLVGYQSKAEQAAIYSTGFEEAEGFTAATVYNNTTVKYDGPAGRQWGTYYGTASTTSPVAGSQSMQMRWYTSAPENLGYTFMDFDLPYVTKVVFLASSTSDLDVTVSYSVDGGVTYTGETRIALSTTAAEYTYDVSDTGEFSTVRLKFQIALPDPAPGGTSRLYIDDVEVFGIEMPGLFASPGAITGLSYYLGEGPSEAHSFELSGANLDGTDVTITAPADFLVSEDNIEFADELTLAAYDGTPTTLWVHLAAGLSAGNYSGDISISGGGVDPVAISVNGSVLMPPTTEVPFSTRFEEANNWQLITVAGSYGEKAYGEGGWHFHSTDAIRGTGDETFDGSAFSFRDRGAFSVVNDFAMEGMTGFAFQLRDWMVDDGRDREIQMTLDGGVNWEVLLVLNKGWFDEYQVYQQFTHYFDEARDFAAGDFQITITDGGGANDGRINIGQFKVFDQPRSATTFTGTGSWSDPERWSDGVPLQDVEALVEGEATLDADVNLDVLTIHSDGSVTVPGSHSLKVTGSLTNHAGAGGLLIEQGGALMHSKGGVTGTYKWSPPGTGWHFLSAPVAGLNILESDFVPPVEDDRLPGTFDFLLYDQAGEQPWIHLREEGGLVNQDFDQNFGSGKGYLVAYSDDYEGDAPFAFTGAFNSGNVWADLAYVPESEWAGWNLIGNPFPAGFNWGGANKDALEDDFAYLYDGTSDNYVAVEDGILAPGQGFLVVANGTDDIFNFASSLRVPGGAYVKSSTTEDVLLLGFGNDSRQDFTTLRILEGTGTERDRRDALKLFSFSEEMPQVFTHSSDGNRLAVNSIPEAEDELVIPVGLLVPEAGTYAISLDEASGQFAGRDVYLYDRETETEVLLSDEPTYSFEAAATGDDPRDPRFEIRFQPVGDNTRVHDPAASLARIYAWDNTLVVAFVDTAPQRVIELYDLSGRLLMQQVAGHTSEFRQVLDLQPGVYVVRVSDNHKTQTGRVFIQ
jgi:hypothetical protein